MGRLKLWAELRARFPAKPWLTVLGKGDLAPSAAAEAALAAAPEHVRSAVAAAQTVTAGREPEIAALSVIDACAVRKSAQKCPEAIFW